MHCSAEMAAVSRQEWAKRSEAPAPHINGCGRRPLLTGQGAAP